LRFFDHKQVVPIRDSLTLTLSRWEREWITPLLFLMITPLAIPFKTIVGGIVTQGNHIGLRIQFHSTTIGTFIQGNHAGLPLQIE
jgi:hypothetical protein